MPSNTLRVLTLNVRGLNNPIKRKALISYLDSTGADVCLLQETHLLQIDTHCLRSRHFPTQLFSSASSKRAGVAILLSRPFGGRVEQKVAELKGRLLAYQLTIAGQAMVIGSIYAPNDGQDAFLRSALLEVTANNTRSILLGGGF